jgi:ribonuclease E
MLFNALRNTTKRSRGSKKMLINVSHPEESRVAIIEDHKLVNLAIESSSREKQRGNIYKGVVQKVEPSLRAAFVDFGGRRHGFLPLDEVHLDYYRDSTSAKKATPSANKILRKDQKVLVQVAKEEKETKGALLTTYASLPGRYLVLMPREGRTGISRKIEDESERRKLKEIARQLNLPDGMGFIIRTAGLNKTKRDLQKDANYLLRLWQAIKGKQRTYAAPSLIYQESNVVIQSIRDYFETDINEVVVDNREMFKEVKAFFKQVIPKHQRQVKLYEENKPLFLKYHVEEQIESIFEREVPLKSGGSISIDPTEALVAIDVNSAKFTRSPDPEETALITNLEAADEIARQLCLRDLGGLIVIDFIDMKSPRKRHQVERYLKDAFKTDKANIEISNISKFGLLEMIREQIRSPITDVSYTTCSYCRGKGKVKSTESLSLTILRKINTKLFSEELSMVKARLSPRIVDYLQNEKRTDIYDMEKEFDVKIVIIGDEEMATDQYKLEYSAK